jgi:hypothetical protein
MATEQSGKAQLLFFDGDRFGAELSNFAREIEKINPAALCVVASVQKEFLQKSGAYGRRSLLVEKPLGLWSVQTALREVLFQPVGIHGEIELERDGPGKPASESRKPRAQSASADRDVHEKASDQRAASQSSSGRR